MILMTEVKTRSSISTTNRMRQNLFLCMHTAIVGYTAIRNLAHKVTRASMYSIMNKGRWEYWISPGDQDQRPYHILGYYL